MANCVPFALPQMCKCANGGEGRGVVAATLVEENVYSENVALYVLYTLLYTFGRAIGNNWLQNRPRNNDLRRIATV